MPLEEIVGAFTVFTVVAYAVTGGADFGGGIWDMFAGGPRRDEQRAAIARAMGPVWEANHVWLIFVIVLIFTAFPSAFSALSIGLFVPFHLVLLGITLRGAAFVFRGRSAKLNPWGVVFGAASVVTPFLLGMCLGAVSVDHLRWLGPFSWVMGAFALAICAYLAAVYLTKETRGEMQEDFRRRALFSGTAVIALGAITPLVAFFASPHLWEGLASLRSAPAVAMGAAATLVSGWGLWKRRYVVARAAAAVQVIMLVAGWALAQYPYIIFPSQTLQDAAPAATLKFVVWTLPVGAILLGPSLWLLFRVFKSEPSTTFGSATRQTPKVNG
jgi:cytochrome d ubiquinol oxidase subunit II